MSMKNTTTANVQKKYEHILTFEEIHQNFIKLFTQQKVYISLAIRGVTFLINFKPRIPELVV